ncbi:hypothetical protein D1872_276620 [compost metagenome]
MSRLLGSSPNKSIPDPGGTLYLYPNLDGVFFNFGESDSLSSVTITLKSSSNTKYTEIQSILGKGSFTITDDYDPNDDIPYSSLEFQFGITQVYFFSYIKDKAEYVIIKHH